MSKKTLVWLGLFVGSTLGAYVPAIWNVGVFSYSSAVFSALGGLLGIWMGFKLGND